MFRVSGVRTGLCAFALCLLAPLRAGASSEGETGPWGPGQVVWESNRSGAWRIWTRPLEGGVARQLSPDEPDRDHCCAHLSPDGRRLAYLSLPGGARSYLPPETPGVLHLLEADGTLDRIAATAARAYGEHRAAIWWSEDQLVYIDGTGATVRLDLSSGARTPLVEGPETGEGWLLDPTGRWATGGTPTFSERDRTGQVRRAPLLGGCQPYFDARGRFGVWAAGAGGPIDGIDLATRRTFSILDKNDARLPEGRRYVYFPMFSRDGSLLAFAASDGAHDHFRADYDVFVVELDPEDLTPVGNVVRISADPAVDRFPDVHRARPPRSRAPRVEVATSLPLRSSAWPADGRALTFVWERADRLNRRSPEAASELLLPNGRAIFDRRGRMSLGGGTFNLADERSAEVIAELQAANTLSLQIAIEPADLVSEEVRPIVGLATRPGPRGFVLQQRGRAIELVLRTSETGPAAPPQHLGDLPVPGLHHLAFTFSPGRLTFFLNGARTNTAVLPGDFFHWSRGWLEIGAEPAKAPRFRGTLSHLAIHARERSPAEIESDARYVLADLAATPPVVVAEVDARLLARSRLPTLEEISPYRQALVVEEWEVTRTESGVAPRGRLRVARWALLDGAPTPESVEPIGTVRRLRLEPYAAQPQLESVVLSDTLPPAERETPPLAFDIGWSGG